MMFYETLLRFDGVIRDLASNGSSYLDGMVDSVWARGGLVDFLNLIGTPFLCLKVFKKEGRYCLGSAVPTYDRF